MACQDWHIRNTVPILIYREIQYQYWYSKEMLCEHWYTEKTQAVLMRKKLSINTDRYADRYCMTSYWFVRGKLIYRDPVPLWYTDRTKFGRQRHAATVLIHSEIPYLTDEQRTLHRSGTQRDIVLIHKRDTVLQWWTEKYCSITKIHRDTAPTLICYTQRDAYHTLINREHYINIHTSRYQYDVNNNNNNSTDSDTQRNTVP